MFISMFAVMGGQEGGGKWSRKEGRKGLTSAGMSRSRMMQDFELVRCNADETGCDRCGTECGRLLLSRLFGVVVHSP